MKHSVDCLPCLLQQAVRTAKRHLPHEEDQMEMARAVIAIMATLEEDESVPYIVQKIQTTLKKHLNNPDPFKEEKDYYNREMLKLEDELIQLRDSCADPFVAGLKLAAAGNIIDFGPGYDLSRNMVLESIRETLAREYCDEVLISLQADLEQATTVLYLGDNAGEIVFDKIFIAAIKEHYPQLVVYFATRGKPILNDVTEADAYLVGMDRLAIIINNGTDIPGTVLPYCSPDFVKIFDQANVIISKGQGNFESLYGSGRENLYYIFLCKCGLFMDRLGAKQNDIILMRE
ncbi:MAG: damage-control phosphatase ARMT1 family protein [Syntrophomonadaceae bacterium]|jgi:uncharacterized protein with ATP-grasp and redox domains